MSHETEDYDTVRVRFDDESSTIIHVHRDDSIQDAIATLCEENGWDLKSVTSYSIEG